MESDKDHLHLLVDIPQTMPAISLVPGIKQISTFNIYTKHSYMLKKHFWKENTFWSDGYFVCSTGNASSETKNILMNKDNRLTSPTLKGSEFYGVNYKCKEYGIPKPISLAYPGNRTDLATQAIVKQMGYRYAPAGGSKLYNPGKDSRHAIPSYTMGSSEKLKPRTEKVLSQLKPGQILAFTIHGVPYYPHPAYSTTPKDFETFCK